MSQSSSPGKKNYESSCANKTTDVVRVTHKTEMDASKEDGLNVSVLEQPSIGEKFDWPNPGKHTLALYT